MDKATLPKHVAAHAHFLEVSLISFQGNGCAVFVGDDPFYNFVCVCGCMCVCVRVCWHLIVHCLFLHLISRGALEK